MYKILPYSFNKAEKIGVKIIESDKPKYKIKVYYKDKIIYLKSKSDNYHNKIMLLSFTDDIYNKYQIDLINIHKNIMTCINNNDDDNISVMSDLSDLSDLNDIIDDN